MLEFAVRCDGALNQLADRGFDLDDSVARPDELSDLPGTIGEIATVMSSRVSAESAVLIEDLAATLNRKFQGARYALENSPDPVSQAANPLVELIDRMLRAAFPSEEVLHRADCHLTGRTDLTYVDPSGVRRPTKFCVALCLSYAGGEINEHAAFVHELAAQSLVVARRQLEKLKHADSGTEEEKSELLMYLAVVEAALLLVCKVAWLTAKTDNLQRVKERLAPSG